ncbi:MAG: hypothetical protein ACLQFR_11800 [Streptosporangiaceae bacterium]
MAATILRTLRRSRRRAAYVSKVHLHNKVDRVRDAIEHGLDSGPA